MKAYSIQGSGDRWFWCAWMHYKQDFAPAFYGYALSKSEALYKVTQSLTLGDLDEAMKFPSNIAKKYRGVLPKHCSRCNAFDEWIIGPGEGKHFARLVCANCGKHDRWINAEQVEIVQQRKGAAC